MKLDRSTILFTIVPATVSVFVALFFSTVDPVTLGLLVCVFMALHILDWGTTLDIADRPFQYYEASPLTANIIGVHPTRKAVHQFMAASLLLTLLACTLIGPAWAGKLVLIRIITTGVAVANNYWIGLRMAFK
jgi:hypothetical protein